MDYDQTTPCSNCPFRNDGRGVYLSPDRVDEIEAALERGPFPCHKTIDYDQADDDIYTDDLVDLSGPAFTNASHCAGA